MIIQNIKKMTIILILILLSIALFFGVVSNIQSIYTKDFALYKDVTTSANQEESQMIYNGKVHSDTVRLAKSQEYNNILKENNDMTIQENEEKLIQTNENFTGTILNYGKLNIWGTVNGLIINHGILNINGVVKATIKNDKGVIGINTYSGSLANIDDVRIEGGNVTIYEQKIEKLNYIGNGRIQIGGLAELTVQEGQIFESVEVYGKLTIAGTINNVFTGQNAGGHAITITSTGKATIAKDSFLNVGIQNFGRLDVYGKATTIINNESGILFVKSGAIILVSIGTSGRTIIESDVLINKHLKIDDGEVSIGKNVTIGNVLQVNAGYVEIRENVTVKVQIQLNGGTMALEKNSINFTDFKRAGGALIFKDFNEDENTLPNLTNKLNTIIIIVSVIAGIVLLTMILAKEKRR